MNMDWQCSYIGRKRVQERLYYYTTIQCCGSGMFIPDPDFYPSRFPDPKTATKERGEKKICCHNFLCSHKFHKIENYFSFEVLKKMCANFQRIIELSTQKILTKLSKYMGLGSGIRKKTYSGSRIQGSKRHRIPDPDPQHCYYHAAELESTLVFF